MCAYFPVSMLARLGEQRGVVTKALRNALMAYRNLDGPDAALVIVALFGVTNAKRVAPMVDELAHSVQPKV